MAQLIVRRVEDELVKCLKKRARKKGVSMEEEHRRLLRAALLPQAAVGLHEYLSQMPDVGCDADFERPKARPRSMDFQA